MLKEIAIINGPNLNLLGKRELDIYGNESMEQYIQRLSQKSFLSKIKLSYAQTNHEGALIDLIHEKSSSVIGIVLNAGAYTHTSLAIADAIRSVSVPVVEVHLSNIFAREEIRHHSLIASACKGSICGFGMISYKLATISLLSRISTLD